MGSESLQKKDNDWQIYIEQQYTDMHPTYIYHILKARIERKEIWDRFGPPMFFSPCTSLIYEDN